MVFVAVPVLLICLLAVVQAAPISYSFVVKKLPSNPDGYPRSVIGVFNESSLRRNSQWNTSRPFPGPTIRGKLGDTVTLRIKNAFDDVSTSIHFHGLHMLSNPWMDGVADLTQPAIPPGHTFTYVFNLTHTGTFWYHSHSGVQYGDGLLGPIIVDYPDGATDPIKKKFNYTNEYTLLIQEWFHENGDDLLTNYRGPYDAFRTTYNQPFVPNYPWRASSILINGRGQFDKNTVNNSCVNFFGHTRIGPFSVPFPYNPTCDGKTQCLYERDPFFGPLDPNSHPLDEFQCEGRYIRLRLINGGVNLPMRFWIDQHIMTVVARDGLETVPLRVRSVALPVALRLDVIVPCDQPKMKYRMFVTAAHSFLPDGANTPPLAMHSSAYLTYPDATAEAEVETSAPDGYGYDLVEPETFEYRLSPLDEKRRMTPGADHRIVLHYSDAYDIYAGHPLEEWTMNNITHKMPAKPLLQHVYLGNSPSSANAYHGKGSEGNLLQTHLISLEYGKTYEVVMISMNGQQHPFHIHGYYLDFIKTGSLNNTKYFYTTNDSCNYTRSVAIREDILEKVILDGLKLEEPAKVLTVGDSFTVPRKGFVIFRFTADNQGPWLMHCHALWHQAQGMAVIFSVEKNGGYPDIVPPPDDFPAYLPLKQFKPQVGACNRKGQNAILLAIYFVIAATFYANER